MQPLVERQRSGHPEWSYEPTPHTNPRFYSAILSAVHIFTHHPVFLFSGVLPECLN